MGSDVLVVGARSLLGRSLVGHLLSVRGPQSRVVATARDWSTASDVVWPAMVRRELTGSIVDFNFEPVGVVYFLPGVTQMRNFGKIDAIDSTLSILSLFANILSRIPPHCTVVLASAGGVYASQGHVSLTETLPVTFDPARTQSLYPATKGLLEVILHQWCHLNSGSAVIARIFHTFGPYSQKGDERTVASFFRRAGQGLDIELTGNHDQVRSFAYATDVAAALEELSCQVPRGTTLTANVGAPRNSMTIREFAFLVADAFGVNVRSAPARISPQQNPSIELRPDTQLMESLVATRFRTVSDGIRDLQSITGCVGQVDV